MTIPSKPLHRRTLLRGAGGIAVALPFLDAMNPRRAAAQAAPRRLVVWFTPMGTTMDTWSPTSPKWDPANGIGPASTYGVNQGPGRLGVGSHLVPEIGFELGRQMKPLERYKQDLLILQGLRATGGHAHTYGPATTLVARSPAKQAEAKYTSGGISIDQHIVGSLKLADKTRIPSLHLGVNVSKKDGEPPYLSWKGANDPVTPQDNPYEVFKQLFGQFTGAKLDPATLARLRAARKSVLDSVLQNADTFTAKLGAEDRQKLGAHLDGIRQIEKNLADAKLAAGGMCKVPELGAQMVDWTANDNVPAVGKLMMDLTVMALACDLTRVVTIQWGREGVGAAYSHTWIPGAEGGWHGVSHHKTDAWEKMTRIGTWYFEQLAAMADRMKTVNEGARNLLDQSVIYSTSSFGPGNEDDVHSHFAIRLPCLLVGSCGGAFKTGRNLLYGVPVTTSQGENGGWAHPSRPRNNQLFVALMNAMGVAGDTFGDPMAAPAGPLPRLAG